MGERPQGESCANHLYALLGREKKQPKYTDTMGSGMFVATVEADGYEHVGRGRGSRKKDARESAAQDFLSKIRERSDSKNLAVASSTDACRNRRAEIACAERAIHDLVQMRLIDRPTFLSAAGSDGRPSGVVQADTSAPDPAVGRAPALTEYPSRRAHQTPAMVTRSYSEDTVREQRVSEPLSRVLSEISDAPGAAGTGQPADLRALGGTLPGLLTGLKNLISPPINVNVSVIGIPPSAPPAPPPGSAPTTRDSEPIPADLMSLFRCEDVVSDQDILKAARHIGNNRETVALGLGLSQVAYENCSYRENDPLSINRKFLHEWRQKKSRAATMGDLCKVLWKCQAYDAVRALKRM
ncbi:uncharacterized protein LOC119100982 [Pollicipes pollicipes]|uniref:uncharacterized protein LOC119100982 n=1 Tax=Pollicipes pollicipes TaxID=41117 RepID=UPI0018849AFD|nr:uncharacterized protein LOC119100982 [Pollicipes pollicipes]